MPEKVTYDVCQQSTIGSQLFEEFVSNTIQTNKVNLWAPMKKCRLQVWKSRGKPANIKQDDKLVELKENWNLFAHLVVVAKPRPHINFDEAVGKYELSVVPKSLFDAVGQMLRCSVNSKLMTILQSLNAGTRVEGVEKEHPNLRKEGNVKEGHDACRVVLVDAMAEVQALDKRTDWISNCCQLADHFIYRLNDKYNHVNEVQIIFDRYDVPHS